MLTNEFHFAGVPHQISTDFMKTVKRLDGIDYDMHSKFLLPPCLPIRTAYTMALSGFQRNHKGWGWGAG